IAVVLGVLQDKDARGIVEALAPVATAFYVTQSQSERAIPADELLDIVRETSEESEDFDSFEEAIVRARDWAAESERRTVIVTGSITLVGEAIELAAAGKWKR
ncbi:MAG: dihydrofolate synthase, partial [Actinobacteria bacterium]|nr:dihydrofolate synthase [Actinomycetota bacterium]